MVTCNARVRASPGSACGGAISGAFEVAVRLVRGQEHHQTGHPSRGDSTRAAGARGAWLGRERGGSRAGNTWL